MTVTDVEASLDWYAKLFGAKRFDEARAGLDHLSFLVEGRAALEAWMARLDDLGIAHTGIRDP